MDPLRRQCAGRESRKFADFPAGYWFEHKGSTYCGHCVSTRVVKQEGLSVLESIHGGVIKCDSLVTSAERFCVRKEGIVISIVNPNTHLPFPRAADSEATFQLPTQADYAVRVGKDMTSDEWPGPMDSNNVFQVSLLKVGDKSTKLFSHDRDTYITQPIEWNGSTPGGKDSHRFVSLTSGEKADPTTSKVVLAKYNQDNVIEVRVQKFQRQVVAAMARRTSRFDLVPRSYGMQKIRDPDVMRGGGSEGSFGVECSDPIDLFSMDLLGGGGGVREQSRLTGGTTVSGGQAVKTQSTTDTRDKFIPVGPPIVFILQLACFQSDSDKEADNKRMALHDAGYDYWINSAKKAEKRITKLARQVAELNQQRADAQRRAEELHKGHELILFDTDFIPESAKRAHLMQLE